MNLRGGGSRASRSSSAAAAAALRNRSSVRVKNAGGKQCPGPSEQQGQLPPAWLTGVDWKSSQHQMYHPEAGAVEFWSRHWVCQKRNAHGIGSINASLKQCRVDSKPVALALVQSQGCTHTGMESYLPAFGKRPWLMLQGL